MPPYIPRCTGPNRKHQLEPDLNVLGLVICANCGASQSLHKSKDQPLYLKHRRALRQRENLVTVSVPLDYPSAQLFKDISLQCGIVSTTRTAPNITFAEGLLPHAIPNELLDDLSSALAESPHLMIRKVHKVQQRKKNSDLIIADIEVGSNVRAVTKKIEQGWNCRLPQFPIHITLGTVPRSNMQSIQALRMARFHTKGLVLGVDHRGMKMTSPNTRIQSRKENAYLGEDSSKTFMYNDQSSDASDVISTITQVTEEATIASGETELKMVDLPPGFDLSFLDFDEDEQQCGEGRNNELLDMGWESMVVRELGSYIEPSIVSLSDSE